MRRSGGISMCCDFPAARGIGGCLVGGGGRFFLSNDPSGLAFGGGEPDAILDGDDDRESRGSFGAGRFGALDDRAVDLALLMVGCRYVLDDDEVPGISGCGGGGFAGVLDCGRTGVVEVPGFCGRRLCMSGACL